jgi:hypothetical protein
MLAIAATISFIAGFDDLKRMMLDAVVVSNRDLVAEIVEPALEKALSDGAEDAIIASTLSASLLMAGNEEACRDHHSKGFL